MRADRGYVFRAGYNKEWSHHHLPLIRLLEAVGGMENLNSERRGNFSYIWFDWRMLI